MSPPLHVAASNFPSGENATENASPRWRKRGVPSRSTAPAGSESPSLSRNNCSLPGALSSAATGRELTSDQRSDNSSSALMTSQNGSVRSMNRLQSVGCRSRHEKQNRDKGTVES